MARSWTGPVELHVELDGSRGRRDGVEHALRQAIHDGGLGPGTTLPSSRALAAELGLARGTVVEAYAQLAAEGYVVATPGGRTSVAPRALAPVESADDVVAEAYDVDLRPGMPDVGSFPRTLWLQAVRAVLAEAPDAAFGYGDGRGRPELRRAVAAHLARTRGVRADPSRVVVCSGFRQAIALLARALPTLGHEIVAVEDPGLSRQREVLRGEGVSVVRLPIDGEGADIDAVAGGPTAAIVTPAHQFPTGVPLAPARRRRLLEWAAERGAVVVEDDYDGEFRYDRHPTGALQALAPASVVYCGTASKALAPGMSLGWMVVPSGLLEAVVEVRRTFDVGPPAIDQLALAHLLDGRRYDRHLRARRTAYRRRRDRLVAELAAVAPHVRPTGIAAGLQLVAELPAGVDEAGVVASLAERSIGVLGLDELRDGARPPGACPSLVVGYARPPEHAYADAVSRFATAMAVVG